MAAFSRCGPHALRKCFLPDSGGRSGERESGCRPEKSGAMTLCQTTTATTNLRKKG